MATSDPQITLAVSDDGGRTWSNERSASIGKIGEWQTLARFRRLGRSQNRAFRIRYSENTAFAVISADLDASDGK